MATGPLSARLRQIRYQFGLLRFDEPQALSPEQGAQARANIGAASAAETAPAARQVIAGAAMTGGGPLTADVTLGADLAVVGEAQAGTEPGKVMSPLRTRQAIDYTGLGRAQNWQAPARATSTTYQNTTPRPIQVIVSMPTNSSASVQCGALAASMVTIFEDGDWDRVPLTFVVPPGHYYRVNSSDTVRSWTELR